MQEEQHYKFKINPKNARRTTLQSIHLMSKLVLENNHFISCSYFLYQKSDMINDLNMPQPCQIPCYCKTSSI